ncbi:MAG: hypothetical protein WCD11_11230 [Solirubrobacteraceae bacterium]
MANDHHLVPPAVDEIAALVYELLDAHADTVVLADDLVEDGRWAAHVDYLRNLQRVGRETLARLSDTSARRAARGLVKET